MLNPVIAYCFKKYILRRIASNAACAVSLKSICFVAMEVVRAAGMMVFRRHRNTIQYLMMKASYGSKHWTPPKGHVDPGEDLLQTAIRETEEESGLKMDQDYKMVRDFKVETHYKVKSWKDGIVRPKIVTYYLAELTCPDTPVKLSEEHTEFKWLSSKESVEIGGFDNMADIFNQCDEKIRSI